MDHHGSQVYGLHLVLRISEVQNIKALADPQMVAQFLIAVVQRIGMRILVGPVVGQEEGPVEKAGCSSVIILYESHAAIHTYPCLGEAFIDVFSCRTFDINLVIETLSDFFGSHRVSEQMLFDRGVHWGREIDKELVAWMKTTANCNWMRPDSRSARTTPNNHLG
ncbi:MAG: S-adenosylmethionine decarboxylase [Bdellovibrionota bacterium]